MESDKYEVFISYASEAHSDASSFFCEMERVYVCHEVEKDGFADLNAPKQWATIAEHIKGCRCVVVLWDRNYVRAGWCARELRAARAFGRPIILVRRDSTLVPASVRRTCTAVLDPGERVVPAVKDLTRALGEPVRQSSQAPLLLLPSFSFLEHPCGPLVPGLEERGSGVARGHPYIVPAACLGLQALVWGFAIFLGRGDGHHASTVLGMSLMLSLVLGLLVSVHAAVISGTLVCVIGTPWCMSAWSIEEVVFRVSFLAMVAVVLALRLSFSLGFDDTASRGWVNESQLRGLGAVIIPVVLTAVALHIVDGERVPGLIPLPSVVIPETLVDLASDPTIANSTAGRHLPPGHDFVLPPRAGRTILDGALVGAILGLALMIATVRRRAEAVRDRVRYHRKLDDLIWAERARTRRWALVAGSSAIMLGIFVGIVSVGARPAAGVGAGLYAGALVGLLLGSTASLGRVLTVRHLHATHSLRWTLAAVLGVVAVVTLELDALPFARARQLELGLTEGSLLGLLVASWLAVAIAAVLPHTSPRWKQQILEHPRRSRVAWLTVAVLVSLFSGLCPLLTPSSPSVPTTPTVVIDSGLFDVDVAVAIDPTGSSGDSTAGPEEELIGEDEPSSEELDESPSAKERELDAATSRLQNDITKARKKLARESKTPYIDSKKARAAIKRAKSALARCQNLRDPAQCRHAGRALGSGTGGFFDLIIDKTLGDTELRAPISIEWPPGYICVIRSPPSGEWSPWTNNNWQECPRLDQIIDSKKFYKEFDEKNGYGDNHGSCKYHIGCVLEEHRSLLEGAFK